MGLWSSIKGFFEDLVEGIVNIGKAIFNFIGDVFSFVIAPFGSVPTPNVSANAGETAKGVTVTKQGTTTHIPIVYGYRRIGGSIVFAETNGDTNRNLYVCYVLCQGEIEGIRKMFIDDIQLPRSMANDKDNTVFTAQSRIKPTSGRFRNLVELQVFYGASDDVQSTLLNESNSWANANRTIPGVAYVAAKFTFPEVKTQEDQENNPWKGGIPTLNVEVFGKKVYDVTQTGADSAGYEFTTTYPFLPKTYSINPVNHLYDYLRDEDFGAGLSAQEFDYDSFVRSGNKCLQYVEYTLGQSGRALTGNQVVLTDRKLIDNVKELVKACRGIMPYVQGLYKLEVEDGGNLTDIKSASANIVYQVTDDDVIGSINLRGEAKNTKFNQVVVNYIEPETDFQNQSYAFPITDSAEHIAALSEDNNEVLKGEFDFPSITNKYMADDFARMIFKKSRNQRQITFNALPKLMTVIPGDIITVTNARLGLSGTSFRVTGMNIRPDSTVSIEAVEHIETNYPYITQDEKDTFEQPKLPDPIIPDPIKPQDPINPPGVIPPKDPDPNPPVDIEPNPPTDGTDSAGYPIKPIQNPVQPPAPDEVEMPSPTDVPVKNFGYGTNYSAWPDREYIVGTSAFDQSQLIDLKTGSAPVDGSFENAVNIIDSNFDPLKADITIANFRNFMVKKGYFSKPFVYFQGIADDTDGGDNPYDTNGELGGLITFRELAVGRQVGDTLNASNCEHFVNDYIDSAGYPYGSPSDIWDPSIGQDSFPSSVIPPVKVTFASAHGLEDHDIIKFNGFSNMGNWQYYIDYPSTQTWFEGVNFKVRKVDATTIELYYPYLIAVGPQNWNCANDKFVDNFIPFNLQNSGVNEADQRSVIQTTSGAVQFIVSKLSTNQPNNGRIEVETKTTFEKLRTFPTTSVFNPYEDWTVDQNLGNTGSFAVSPNIGRQPQCQFEFPNDYAIRTRGPKGLYPKVMCNVPRNVEYIIIYRGQIGGGLEEEANYIFNMREEKFVYPGTAGPDALYAWPWGGGNHSNFNVNLLVRSTKDFFKIRFADRFRQNIFSDGSRPTPNTAGNFYHDPALRFDLPAWTYTNEKGETVSGYGIEAYLNYSIQQLSADQIEANPDTITNHALGG